MRIQSATEEKLNTITHAIGAVFGIIALALLIVSDTRKTDYSLTSVIIYGFSIIILFSASAFYHAAKTERKKRFLRIIDHISIYLLIAGTYTPVLLITLEQSLGWTLFYVVWGIAVFGVVLKTFFTGRFELFSTLLYLAMGWLIIFDFTTLSQLIDANGILFLFAGGVAYTVGIIFYVIEKIPYNHVIWHIFVLAGAIFHFLMIFLYVI
ncbi:PAQR family membrane homeostasis protein TrhA [Hyunsoonleella sp. 2307UL5-6]|uniref:PAQR family membrane homeostasis protein TrhA n=1 Tax=Hyunsoonleella sp. 2307UL5-6 TaxID=3384768 RepID=UPI0039BC7C4A